MPATVTTKSLILLPALILVAWSPVFGQTTGEEMAAEYFRRRTETLARRSLADIRSLDEWSAKRDQLRGQLLEMLGLAPLPPRTGLRARVTGRLEHDLFTVEKIHFQSLPGLYVTANLYLPRRMDAPVPAILYLCGHSRVFKDGVAYGNKANYQHHPAWFAEQGFAALIIDTLDLGEIEGEHHGTSRRGWWWWPSLGYTPAGVETWNAIRALDYLETRREVDPRRIGVTGRSGGGAYTWFLAAVDDRPSVLVPVAGITDLTNHVVDGAIEGHCDCMYMCNTHAWDFSTLAALVAPRALLVANSDKDRIFPLDGVQRVHRGLQRIYRLYGAEEKLGLFISEGPHSDTQELQLASFRWMNRWLRKNLDPVAQVAVKRFTPEQLRVFDSLPEDQINTRIHDVFVPRAGTPSVPASRAEWLRLADSWKTALREKVFHQWPREEGGSPPMRVLADGTQGGIRSRNFELGPDEAYRLPVLLLSPAQARPRGLMVQVLGNDDADLWYHARMRYLPVPASGNPTASAATLSEMESLLAAGTAVALVMPRGVGPTGWPAARDAHIRRRFLLLGQSLEAMQIWDTRVAIRALREIQGIGEVPATLRGSGPMAIVALFAGILEDSVSKLELEALAATLSEGQSIPNALRFLDVPQVLALALPRSVALTKSNAADWQWAVKIMRLAGGNITFR